MEHQIINVNVELAVIDDFLRLCFSTPSQDFGKTELIDINDTIPNRVFLQWINVTLSGVRGHIHISVHSMESRRGLSLSFLRYA